MTTQINDRRDRTRFELHQLVKDRTEMLSQYCQLAVRCNQVNSGHFESKNECSLLQEFCQNLIDYLARGHFELYQRINEGNERRHDIIQLSKRYYPRIAETTNYAVDFNDAYDQCLTNNGEFDQFAARLNRLGEELAVRFELEDMLIEALLAPKEELLAISA